MSDQMLTADPRMSGLFPAESEPAERPLWRGDGAEDGVDRPRLPAHMADLGLSSGFLEDLVLKTLYSRGASTGDQLTAVIRLPFWALDDLLVTFQTQKLAQVLRSDGLGRRTSIFELTTEGRQRAREVFASSPYVGPAPVHIDRYHYWVKRQATSRVHVGPERVREGFQHLVIAPETLDVVGPAINSARSIFLHGAPGNGKTSIAEATIGIFDDPIYVPWAIYTDGEVIQLFDPVSHEEIRSEGADGPEPIVFPAAEYDQRFALVKRPMVMVGGELTLAQLELHYDPSTGSYHAPPQMKANGGVFIIDDFGRQQMAPRELLNRWMIPLDRGVDFLTFRSGRRVRIPFASIIVFATNLNPAGLVEEAFLRRIRYKIKIGNPDRAAYTEIFRRLCQIEDIPFDEGAVGFIFQKYYDGMGVAPRCCHPRDLLNDIVDLANYYGRGRMLDRDLLEQACDAYFMELAAFAEPEHG